MAWQTIGYTGLYYGSSLVGYTYFEYDDSSSEPRSVRLRIQEVSGSTFDVKFLDVTVDGTNVGSWQSITQSSGTFWTGTLSGGRTVEAHWCNPWYAGYKYPSVSGNLPSGITPPSGLGVEWISHTWNSVTGKVTLSSYGVPSSANNRYIELGVCDSANSNYGAPYRYTVTYRSANATMTVQANSSGALTLKGMTNYKLGGWATNTERSTSALQSTIRHTPPAPLQSITKTETEGDNYISTVFTITGGDSTNNTNATVRTQFRWSSDGGSTWTGWNNISTTGTAWTAVSTPAQNIPYGSSIKVQARQKYYDEYSEVKELSYNSTAATAPSGLAIAVGAKNWNSVQLTGSVGNYGRPKSISGRALNIGLAETASINAAAMEVRSLNTSSKTVTVNQSSTAVRGGLTFKGMMTVYPYTYANNTKAENVTFGNAEVLPPAPGQLSYSIDPTDESKQTITYVGVAADNITNYDPTLLKRTVRYEDAANPGVWTYIVNDVQTALTTTTTQLITVPGSHTYNVEAWMTYDGVDSQKSIVPLTNTQDPKKLYCSVYDSTYGERVTKTVDHLYGTASEKILASIEKDSSQIPPAWLVDVGSVTFCGMFNDAPIASLVAPRQALQESGARIRDIEVGYTADGYYLRINVVSIQSLDTFYIGEDLTAEELLDLLNLFAIDHASYDPDFSPIPANDTMYVITTLGDGTGKVTKKIKKLYASVNGVAKLIHEDI